MASKKKEEIDIQKALIGVFGTSGGGVATRILTKRVLPQTMNPILANGIPFLIGAIAPLFFKGNDFVDSIGSGMVAVAAADAVSSLGQSEAVSGLASEYGLGSLASEYNIGNSGEEMALYDETLSIGAMNDARNSIAGFATDWGSNPSKATRQSLAGNGDARNSLAGMNYISGLQR